MLTLPQRMDGNRLHRFSKVLDTNIGQAHDMFSRIFRIRIYEFFLQNIILLPCPSTRPEIFCAGPDIFVRDEKIELHLVPLQNILCWHKK
jgi:hypothetical protein